MKKNLERLRETPRALAAGILAALCAIGAAVLLAVSGDALPVAGAFLLGAAAGGCAVYGAAALRFQRKAEEARALAERITLLEDNCRILDRSVRGTSDMRHQWKNNVLALQLVAKKGDLPRLRSMIDTLTEQVGALSVRQFSPNFTVNTILRSAARRAAEAGIDFDAGAPLPEEPGVEAEDLGAFLSEMLEAALRGAASAPIGARRIQVDLKQSHGYLAFRCQYTGGPEAPDLARLRGLARKYDGILDASQNGGTVTIDAGLKTQQG